MHIEIIEDPAVAPAGAVYASNGNRAVIVIDPHLPAHERQRLIEELTGG